MFLFQFAKFIKYFGKGYYLSLMNMLFLAFMSSLLDFASVAIIFPFIMLIMNPNQIKMNPYFLIINHFLHLSGDRNLITAVGLAFITIIIIKNIYMIFNMYWQNKIIKEWSLSVKKRLMHYFLYAPYEEDLQQSNSQRIFQITSHVDQVFDNFVFRVITFISNTIVIIVIFSWLIYLLPIATIIAALFFIVTGSIQNRAFRRIGRKLADEQYLLTTGSYENLISSLMCIKDIKINGCENFFYDTYKKISSKLIPLAEKLNLIPIIPQFVIEIIFVLTMVILCVGIFIQYGGNTSHVMVAFGVVAISLYRIAPLIYKSQVCINYINIYNEYLEKMIAIYDHYKKYDNNLIIPTEEKLSFHNGLTVKDLSYSYDKKNLVLDNINFNIKKGEFIGIIGLSGAGKTTLVDLLMGLLIGEGDIFIDNDKLTTDNTRKFQNIVGYVSQNINTIGDTVTKNIAWGIDEDKINEAKIIESLKIAQLYDQLMLMPFGINTKLNQDGTGLSQGQKQRIGIARALYRNPEILILDEATSSLDVKIENEFTEILNTLKGDKTIIAISHRFSMLKHCDRIIYLHEGKLIDIGTFNELSDKYPEFEKIIKLSKVQLD